VSLSNCACLMKNWMPPRQADHFEPQVLRTGVSLLLFHRAVARNLCGETYSQPRRCKVVSLFDCHIPSSMISSGRCLFLHLPCVWLCIATCVNEKMSRCALRLQ
jgi:hypothetical protein